MAEWAAAGWFSHNSVVSRCTLALHQVAWQNRKRHDVDTALGCVTLSVLQHSSSPACLCHTVSAAAQLKPVPHCQCCGTA